MDQKNKQSITLVIAIGLLIGVVAILGILNSNAEQRLNSGSTSDNQGIKIIIDYPGTWKGTVTQDNDIRNINGTGPTTIDVTQTSGKISSSVQKTDNGSDAITVTIFYLGNTITNKTTYTKEKIEVRGTFA